MLAAEYVLGAVERDEAREIEAMAERDPQLATAITEWQDRLAPLAKVVPPVPVPGELWTRLEDAIAPVTIPFPAAKPRVLARAWANAGVWRTTTAGALAMAAAFGGLAIVRNPSEPTARPVYLAELAPTPDAASRASTTPMAQSSGGSTSLAAAESPQGGGASLAQSATADFSNSATERMQKAVAPVQTGNGAPGSTLERFQPAPETPSQPAAATATPQPAPSPTLPTGFIVASMPDGSLVVKPIGSVPIPPGKDMELWAQPPGAQRPVSLGVLPAGGRRVATGAVVQPNTTLMVSLEPHGGAPDGQPTGPVLYSGALSRLE